MKGAMNGDLVVVRVDRKNPRYKKIRNRDLITAEVTQVLRRAHRAVVGRFHADPRGPFVVPFDARIDNDVTIERGETMDARDGEMVNVELDRYPDRSNSLAAGRVVEVLGFIGDPGVDIEVVIRKLHIPHLFPDDVIAEAEGVPSDVAAEEIGRRVDCRDRNIITIDGETAKDFDDAVEVRVLPNGNYLLGVHIADVAHYVREGSMLDEEAFERGTSVYFPGRAIPMLPEVLSNGICSLNPRVERLTFSVDIAIDKHGSRDFDLPEAEVMLGESGDIEAIRANERNVAHRLIEEFMLAANETVAIELVFANQPGLFRVHQQPDPQKLQDLREILKEFKLTLRGDVEDIRPTELQRVLASVAGTPEERFLTNIVLRSMKPAFSSDEDLGHFALGLEHYCHFTSPIRRYPDLIVHRRLAELAGSGVLYGKRRDEVERAHPIYAAQSSDRERRAEEAEREVMEWKKVIFMRDKLGQKFTGIVTGVAPFGLFVDLDEIFVTGMVPVATIGGDFWVFREREHRLRGETSQREMRLGDHVMVEVKSIDEDRPQITFRLLEAGGTPVAQRER